MNKTIRKRIVCPTTDVIVGQYVKSYVSIEWDGERLSITGVVGPKANGFSYGSSGQCCDEIVEGKPAAGWTREMVDKLASIWNEWHLNDLRPYCEHQKHYGWRDLAKEKITVYTYSLSDEARKMRADAESEALTALKEGRTFTPTMDQVECANLKLNITTTEELSDKLKSFYVLHNTEVKTAGWITYREHEKGILGKPCPVCGYKYGSSWILEKVPEDVIDWLFSLPEVTQPIKWFN